MNGLAFWMQDNFLKKKVDSTIPSQFKPISAPRQSKKSEGESTAVESDAPHFAHNDFK